MRLAATIDYKQRVLYESEKVAGVASYLLAATLKSACQELQNY